MIQNTANLIETIRNEIKAAPFLKAGDIVEGQVIAKEGNRRIFIEIGRYGTGVIYASEIMNAREIVRGLKIGDVIKAKVVDIDNEENLIELSLTEATKQKAWEEAIALMEKEDLLTIRPKSFNRGGLLCEVSGLPAFLPISQLSSEHYPFINENDSMKIVAALQTLLNQDLNVRIIDVNPKNRKIIVSERAATQVGAKELIKKYSAGQIIDGIVTGVADFGVFVRFLEEPAIEGMIHISELSHRLIDNVKEFIKIDEPIKAKIVEIKDGKVFLSLKALQPNPWEKAEEYFQTGQAVSGAVYTFNPFGAIINLPHELQGQIHVTEFGGLEEMKKTLAVGQTGQFLIEDVKPAEKRIVLKIKK